MEDRTLLDGTDEVTFKLNNEYAKNYDLWREKEELQKLKDKYGEAAIVSSSSSESESDEDAEDLDENTERNWLKTLSALRSKDPCIYDNNHTFFDPAKGEKRDTGSRSTKEKPTKPYTVKDYDRDVLLKQMAGSGESDEDGESHTATYPEEQQALLQSFHDVAGEQDSDEELFSVNPAADDNDDDNHTEVVKSGRNHRVNRDGDGQDVLKKDDSLAPLKKIWGNPNLDPGEKFLRDYFLNKKYLDEQSDGKKLEQTAECDSADDEVKYSDEEGLLDQQELFERKFNFRYEEPDSDLIKNYPRTVANSVRKMSTKRAEKRNLANEKKASIKEQRGNDIKRLKNLTKKQMKRQLDELLAASGTSFSDQYLLTDFDPTDHDKLMEKMFNDEYYEDQQDTERPQFDFDPLIDSDHDESKDLQNHRTKKKSTKGTDRKLEAQLAPDVANDGADSEGQSGKIKKKLKQTLDQYSKLECEDVLAGVPTRFKYRQVVPNNFGLTTDEILTSSDKELNAWCSLKKAVQYRSKQEELRDLKRFSKKATNATLKEKVFSTGGKSKKVNVHNTDEPRNSRKRRRNKSNMSEDVKPKTKKQRHKDTPTDTMTADRLAAYGIHSRKKAPK